MVITRHEQIFYFKQKTAYEITRLLEFRRVLFRSCAHGETVNQCEGPNRNGPTGHAEEQERCAEQCVEQRHGVLFSKTVCQIAHYYPAAETGRQQSCRESSSRGHRVALIFQKKNEMLNHRADSAHHERGPRQDEPEVGRANRSSATACG